MQANLIMAEAKNTEEENSERPSIFHTCPFCTKVYKSRISKKHHMLLAHLDVKGHLLPVECSKCSECLIDPFIPLESYSAICIKCSLNLYDCAYCDKMMSVKTLRNAHETTCHNDDNGVFQKLKCNYCDEISISPNELRSHLKTEHSRSGTNTEQFNHKCKLCKRGFKIKDDLVTHMAKHRNDNKCLYCSSRFIHDIDRDLHEQKDHMNDTVLCQRCGVKIKSTGHFKGHKKVCFAPIVKQRVPNTRISCKLCDDQFTDIKSLLKHQKIHQNCRCAYCMKIFPSDAKRNSHERKAHVNKDLKLMPIKCHLCDIPLPSSIHFRDHTRIYHKDSTSIY